MQTVLHTMTPTEQDMWRPTLTAGVWMNKPGNMWLSQSRRTRDWIICSVSGAHLGVYRPERFTVTD